MRGRILSRSTLVVFTGCCLAAGGAVVAYKSLRWKNFATVDQGKVYRSGQLSERQLETAIEKYGIRRVVCLNPDFAERERRLCERMGVDFHYFPMPSDGRGRLEQFAAIQQLLGDQQSSKPTLVHCSAGVARTGVACALYRIHHDGWTTDKALEELRSFERRGRMTTELQQHVRQMAVQVGEALKR